MSEPQEILYDRVEWLGKNNKVKGNQSDKFYEITVVLQGTTFVETRRWGKYGAKGQTKVLEHYYEYSALQSARNQIKKKMKKGYTKPIGALTRLAQAAE
jgi:predicted DNA-binding WGR domain protein